MGAIQGMLCGVLMHNGFLTPKKIFGKILVMVVIMTNTHPPIHPTKFSAGESCCSQDYKRIYELVVRHFLAYVSQPALGARTIVDIDIAVEKFTTSGLMVLERNYLEIYRYKSWGCSTIPTFMTQQQFLPTRLTLDACITRPPPLLSEADLLSCMDKIRISTDATMHHLIKKLLD